MASFSRADFLPLNIPVVQMDLRSLLLALSAAVVFTVIYVQATTKKQRLLPGVPIVGGSDAASIKASRKRFIHDSKAMLTEGYQKYKGQPFYVPTVAGERLMIPAKYLEYLKTAPIDKVDFVATFIEMFEGKYTTMGSRSTLHPRVVKAQLNHHLADVMPDVQDEIRDAFEASFPKCDDWTEVNVVSVMTQIVARVSSRMFGGTTLSQNQEWINASIAFALDGFVGAQKIKKYPHFLRPLVQHFIPEIKSINNHYRAAEKAAIPLLNERERTEESALDLLYWMSEQAKGSEQDKKFIAGILLKVSFAAIHTSAAAPSQLIYDLCEMPELQEPLRQEIDEVVDEYGNVPKTAFIKLAKMDSIMKESQRFNPLLLITFERVVTEDYKLPDGFVIPANTQIGVPTQAISMDPEFIPDNPEKYDAFRFARLRETDATKAGKAQYVASNPNNMSFGYGRHACPGRFFAANEIKALMVYLMSNYDMKYATGQKRPESLQFETQYLPDHDTKVLFKRRGDRRHV